MATSSLLDSFPSNYRPPIEQILQLLQLEPSTTRRQKQNEVQNAFKEMFSVLDDQAKHSIQIQPNPSLSEPLPTILPPLYHPHNPHRALPTFTDLSLLSDPTQSSCASLPLLPSSNTPLALPTQPRKRRRTDEDCDSTIIQEVDCALGFPKDPINITPFYSLQSAAKASLSFQQQLQRIQVREMRNKTSIVSIIHPAHIPHLIELFFHNTFGRECQTRMFTLFDEIILQHQGGTQVRSFAIKKSQDTTLLPEMQAFFSTYARWHIEEVKRNQVMPEILNTIREFELYEAFFLLQEKAAGPKGAELRAFLCAQGFSFSVGRNTHSCILNYLAHELGIPNRQLSYTLHAYQPFFLLVQQFGKGVLVLLPKGASHCLTRAGTQKLPRVLQILHDTLPKAAEVCAAAEFLVRYITRETDSSLPPLLGQQVACRPNLSLLETFTLIRPAYIEALDVSPVLAIAAP